MVYVLRCEDALFGNPAKGVNQSIDGTGEDVGSGKGNCATSSTEHPTANWHSPGTSVDEMLALDLTDGSGGL